MCELKEPGKRQCLACERRLRKIRIAKKRQAVWDYLKLHPCPCGETDPVVLEFDHRNPADKSFEIGWAFINGLSLKKIFAEIEKCDVLCANCHRRRTAEQFGYYAWTRQ